MQDDPGANSRIFAAWAHELDMSRMGRGGGCPHAHNPVGRGVVTAGGWAPTPPSRSSRSEEHPAWGASGRAILARRRNSWAAPLPPESVPLQEVEPGMQALHRVSRDSASAMNLPAETGAGSTTDPMTVCTVNTYSDIHERAPWWSRGEHIWNFINCVLAAPGGP